jgi:hypothetical protein
MSIDKLTPELILAAIQGLESKKAKIDLQIAELQAMLPHSYGKRALTTAPARRRASEDG